MNTNFHPQPIILSHKAPQGSVHTIQEHITKKHFLLGFGHKPLGGIPSCEAEAQERLLDLNGGGVNMPFKSEKQDICLLYDP